jgi:hypothetical protein
LDRERHNSEQEDVSISVSVFGVSFRFWAASKQHQAGLRRLAKAGDNDPEVRHH